MNKTAIKRLGVVQQGNVIALTDDLGIAPGTKVEIQIKVSRRRPKLDHSVFGMWKDRKELVDSGRWVRRVRDGEWRG